LNIILCVSAGLALLDLSLPALQRVHPRYHVFGHIHEGYGQTRAQTVRSSSDGTSSLTGEYVDFINASNCNLRYDPRNLNPPIIFDVPLPATQQEQQQHQKQKQKQQQEPLQQPQQPQGKL
jgi:hypothetical protein